MMSFADSIFLYHKPTHSDTVSKALAADVSLCLYTFRSQPWIMLQKLPVTGKKIST